MQISGLRDIAYLADTFSDKGLDAQQFESISRIRCIAQECLRDQVESPIVVSMTPQTELGKRTRGKERVRRKSSGKRKRDNDLMEGHVVSEDESQYCGAVVEVDQIHLREADGEVEHLQLSHAVGDSDDMHMCLDDATDKVDDAEFCDAAHEVDESQLYGAINEVNGSQLCGAVYEVNDSQLSHIATQGHSQSVKVSEEVVTQASQLCDATNAINDSKICNPTEEVKDSQISDATVGVKDPQIPEESATVNDTKTCDPTVGLNNSQIYDTTVEVNDSQLAHVGGEDEIHTAQGGEEVIPQSSLETVEDAARHADNSIVA